MRSIEWRHFQLPWMTPNPQTTQLSTFCNAFHIFVTGEDRRFKFGG